MSYVVLFFAGAFLCNCIPHLSAGLRGEPFPSPFAKPPGAGNSPPVVNCLWGALNFFVGVYLLSLYPVAIGLNAGCLALVVGAVVCGIFLSMHFGKVWQDKHGR